ncbi:branched-chain amino acid ABC transporter substrate-binding protein, partial [Xanthomonas citri pv. citri]|nr:branched-chain amino acid ABC transporter substrate-binding protein [Xanthomonas citri pv. citri]
MTKNTFVVGFMLFAIFFGAGNLIFPPKLGFESGADFWTATIGFI